MLRTARHDCSRRTALRRQIEGRAAQAIKAICAQAGLLWCNGGAIGVYGNAGFPIASADHDLGEARQHLHRGRPRGCSCYGACHQGEGHDQRKYHMQCVFHALVSHCLTAESLISVK